MGKNKGGDNKSADKNAGGKGGKGKADEKETKVKGAQSLNVRHILVSTVCSLHVKSKSFTNQHLVREAWEEGRGAAETEGRR